MNEYVFITASDSSRFFQALNLLGSVQKNSPGFKELLIFDLGFTKGQLNILKGLSGVKVVKVPPFVDHWRQCWTWKPWIWVNSGYSKFIYLDGGTEVLRSLDEICEIIDRNGYFLVSQYETLEKGHTLADIIPKSYYSLLDVPNSIGKNKVVAAGILGFNLANSRVRRIVNGTLKDVTRGLNLGWSKNETWRNTGLNQLSEPEVKNCLYFRHDQTLFNINLYKEINRPIIQPVDKFGGFHSPNDHPSQLIWNSRAHNPLRYLKQLEYDKNKAMKKKRNAAVFKWSALLGNTKKIYNRLRNKIG